jgi:hypothetical protein
MNTGDGSTPTASATPGRRASSRVTAPVPQPTSSTRALGGTRSRKVGIEHRSLLGVGCPQLQDGGQALLGGDVDLGDRGVDVRHAIPSRTSGGVR